MQNTAAKRPNASRLISVLTFIGWQLVALLFVEFVLFTAGLGEEEIFKFDRDLGTRHMTNKRVTWRSEGFAQSYFDSDGLREGGLTVAKPAGTYRVALLGDSLTEGLQVPIESTFGQILSRRLSKSGQKVQVLNFGVSGYATVQEYLQLQKQVLKYSPDLVVLGYNSRDMFENWAPPDQVISNIRPLALHLPGGKLQVSSGPVHDWLRSPRAKILCQAEWLRTHSRIWGILSAVEADWAFHSPIYKEVIAWLTQPVKCSKKYIAQIQDMLTAGTARKSSGLPSAAPLPAAGKTASSLPVPSPAVAETKAPAAVKAQASTKPVLADNKNYVSLMSRTLGSLLLEMDGQCRESGARFAVIALPVRAALCPQPQMETSFFNVKYEQELEILQKLCLQQGIAFLDAQKIASRMPTAEQLKLFYVVHYRPAGQSFMADALQPFFKHLMDMPAVVKSK
jgi:hypothetical protein